MSDSAAATGPCDYCGLPVPRPLLAWRSETPPAGDRYCCTGCRIAAAITQDRGESGEATWTMTSLGLSVFFSMSVMVFTVAHWMDGAYDVQSGDVSDLSKTFGQLLQWLALLFSTPVLLLLGKPLVDDAVQHLKAGSLTSDVLLLTGVAASFAYSIVSVIRGSGPVYFETGCVILLAVTFGRWLSATGKLRTNAALDELERLLPERATVQRAGAWTSIPLAAIELGDVLLVKAGERIPVDGTIVDGRAGIDEQVFTGESSPVLRREGERVYAGTLNLDGTLKVESTAPPGGGAFGVLLDAVRAARNSRGACQILADRVSAAFFPVVAVVALGTLIGHGLLRGWPDGIMASLSVILIACPCALALATPLAVWSAMGRAARDGILFRSGEALEQLARVTAVRFDKTGTLTTGSPRVDDVRLAETTSYRDFALRCRVLAEASNHVFSRALLKLTAGSAVADHDADVRTMPGFGLEALIDREVEPTRLGSWEWLTAMGAASSPALRDELALAARRANSVVAISWSGAIQGVIRLAEDVRPDVEIAIDRLRLMRLDLAVLTGDRAAAAQAFGRRLGLPVIPELSPAEKGIEVRKARSAGYVVAMVGDGINDAPALSEADIGVALGCGTDVTRSSADVCLLRDNLTSLVHAIEISKECVRCIRGNLTWAFAYNAIGVVLAAAGMLHPSFAAILMVVSSLVVVLRSMRLGALDSDVRNPADDAPRASESARSTGTPAAELNELTAPLAGVAS